MRVRIGLITFLVAVLSFAIIPANAQGTAAVAVGGLGAKGNAEPGLAGRAVVGYLATTTGSGVQPILGVAGASRVGSEIDFGVVLRLAAVAPAGGYGVGVLAESGDVVVLDLDGESVSSALDAPPNPDRVLFGPSGGTTALYYRTAGELVVVRDPAGSPTVGEPLTVSGPGIVAALAVADSGEVALAAFSGEASAAVYSLSADGSRFVTQVSRVADLRFLPGSSDALITDAGAGEVILVTNAGEASVVRVAGNAETGLESPEAAASIDGETAYVLSGGAITALDLNTGAVEPVACRCVASGLDAVGHGGRFHLTGRQAGAIALLDGSGAKASIVLVPARPAATLTVSDGPAPARSRSR